MTIKLHECKHKHHHKHHRSDGSRRINFPRDCSGDGGNVGGGSANGSAVWRLKPEEVVQTRADGTGHGELASCESAAAEVVTGVDRFAVSHRNGNLVNSAWPNNVESSSIDCIGGDGRSLTTRLLARQKQPFCLGQQQPGNKNYDNNNNNNNNSSSCSHPTSFSIRFFRSQVLQTVVVLYIALVVIIANAVAAFEPDFVYPLENVTVAKGRDATFTCVVNNLGGYRVSGEATPARVAWIKADAKAILAIHEHVITNNGRLSVTHNDYNTWTLVIRNVKMEDRGLYMCQVNTDPMKMQTAFLEVVIPPDIIYEETSGDMMVPEGGSAKLVCKARGYPKPKIIWRREDGREIIARNGTHGKMKATVVEGEMLSLTKVTRSEMGAYMCIASNGVPPSVSKRMKLQVHFHPLIQVPNQLVGAPLGTDVTVICNVEASPKAINYWQRENGEMIISNERYSMNENESSMYAVQMTLVIRKLHKADMGGYKCISKNSIGDAEGTIRLYEMELQKKTKSAHRLNSVEDSSVNDEINSTPNIEIPEENNKIHKNGRLYKGLQGSEHDLMSSSGATGAIVSGGVHQLFRRPRQSAWSSGGDGGGKLLIVLLLVHLRQQLAGLLLLLPRLAGMVRHFRRTSSPPLLPCSML
ncbi:leucine-rich repeats and immunoglobulin-like domains protein 2 [Sabethes cyaneus]|uniref:leucine-rich repeats and immunoglobulin-like domains protein 2 n=1 Tax=Sabethes cyaneus TaxID=53552 RepID=UPI00237D66CC|nr:leucine-rich repeats and immunoglobulin-like domains protein 2 [Sabethes cyaneus]